MDALSAFGNVINVTCHKCGTSFDVPEKYVGEHVNCTKCGELMLIEAAPAESPQAPASQQPSLPAPAPAELEPSPEPAPSTAGTEPTEEDQRHGAPQFAWAQHDWNTPSREQIEAALHDGDGADEERLVGVVCPTCRMAFHVPESFRGEQAECTECETIFVVPAMGSIGIRVGGPEPEKQEPKDEKPKPTDDSGGAKAGNKPLMDTSTAKISIADIKDTMHPHLREPSAE